MDTRVQEGGGEPTRDDVVRGSYRKVHQGRRKVEAPMMVGHGGLTGSERSHISVSYHDGPLDTSENMYFHETFPLYERWHSRNGHFATIVARIIRFRGFWYSFNYHVYNPLLLLRV